MKPFVMILSDDSIDERYVRITSENLTSAGIDHVIASGPSKAGGFNDALGSIPEDSTHIQIAHVGAVFSRKYWEIMAEVWNRVPWNVGMIYCPYYVLREGNENDNPVLRPGEVPPPYNYLMSRLDVIDPVGFMARREAVEEIGEMAWDWYDIAGEDRLMANWEVPAYFHDLTERWWAQYVDIHPADTYTIHIYRGHYLTDLESRRMCRGQIFGRLAGAEETPVRLPEDLPVVDVVIPCHNHEDYIEVAIRSVLDQDYGGIRVVVVDDASTDGSVEVIRRVASENPERITVIARSENGGMRQALLDGYLAGAGTYWMMISSDDFLISTDLISKEVSMLEGDRSILAATPAIAHTDPDGSWEDVVFRVDPDGNRRGVARPIELDRRVYVNHNLAGLGGSIIRREAIEAVGGIYEEEVHNNLTDYNLFLRLLDRGRVSACRDVLFGYRAHPAANRFNRDEGSHRDALVSLRQKYHEKWSGIPQEEE